MGSNALAASDGRADIFCVWLPCRNECDAGKLTVDVGIGAEHYTRDVTCPECGGRGGERTTSDELGLEPGDALPEGAVQL